MSIERTSAKDRTMAKFVEERKDTSGRTYWAFNPKKYVRDALNVGYQRFRTREEANDHAERIIRAYEDHKARRDKEFRIEEDTVAGLVAFYQSTYEWKKLKDNSQRLYRLMIQTALKVRIGQSNATLGKMLSKNVTPTHADKLQDQITKEYSAHRAVHVVKVLRKIWFVGKRHGKVTFNPFERMGLVGLQDRVVLWTPEQVETLIETADRIGAGSIGTLALLCYDLCQRPSDMRKLRWENLRDGVFRFHQEKTGIEVEIPASERLLARLGTLPYREGELVLCEATQRPYDRFLYNKWFGRVRAAAELPSHLQLRDLRRTGATEMAEAGCTEDELRSVTGHQSRDVLSIYVRPTVRLAASGVNKRFAKMKGV